MTVEEFVEKHEGRKNKVYKCTMGKNTIGVGHNIDAKGLPDDIKSFLDSNGYITEDTIDTLLSYDLADAQEDCEKLYPEFESFSESRQMALIDFLFNVGIGTAKTFRNTNRAINEGKWKEAAQGLLNSKYAKQVKGRAVEVAKLLEVG